MTRYPLLLSAALLAACASDRTEMKNATPAAQGPSPPEPASRISYVNGRSRYLDIDRDNVPDIVLLYVPNNPFGKVIHLRTGDMSDCGLLYVGNDEEPAMLSGMLPPFPRTIFPSLPSLTKPRPTEEQR